MLLIFAHALAANGRKDTGPNLFAPTLTRSPNGIAALTAEGVPSLTTSNFAKFIHDKPAVLVAFVAPWCGISKGIVPEYALAGYNGLSVAFVDCVAHEPLYEKYGIQSFPTIKLFSYGVVAENYPARSRKDFEAATLASFVKAMAPQTVKGESSGWTSAVQDEFPRVETVSNRRELLRALVEGDVKKGAAEPLRASVLGFFPSRMDDDDYDDDDAAREMDGAEWSFRVASNARGVRTARFIEIAATPEGAALAAELSGGSLKGGDAVFLAMPLSWSVVGDDAAEGSALRVGEPAVTLARLPRVDVASGADALATYLAARIWRAVTVFGEAGSDALFDQHRAGYRTHLLGFARGEAQRATVRRALSQIAALHRGALVAVLADDPDMNGRFNVAESAFPSIRLAVSEKRKLKKFALSDEDGALARTVESGDDTQVRTLIESFLDQYRAGSLAEMVVSAGDKSRAEL